MIKDFDNDNMRPHAAFFAVAERVPSPSKGFQGPIIKDTGALKGLIPWRLGVHLQ